MIFEYNLETRIEDVNKNYEVTNKSLLMMMENTAERHSSSIGEGLKDISKTGISWVIVDWKLKVLKRPKYGDKIKVCTWVRNSDRFFSYRDFKIIVNNEIYALATSKWFLLDLTTKEIKSIPENYKINIDEKVFAEDQTKLKLLDEYSNEKSILIRKTDIDFNEHVHNLNYLDYIKEALPEDKCNIEFDNLRIIYKKEIKFDDKIIVKSNKEDEKYYFVISDKNNTVYSIIECN